MSDDLEKRLVAALTDDLTADALAELIAETNAAIKQAEADAVAARDAALDPVKTTDLAAAQRDLEDAQLRHGRLLTLEPKLQERYAAQVHREQRESFEQYFRIVEKHRDAAAQKFAERYPALVAELISLFTEMKKVDKWCAEINSMASALAGEFRRLAGCELHARNLERFSQEAPSLIAEHQQYGIRLPDFANSTKLIWPPPAPNFAATYAASIAAAPGLGGIRYTDQWWVAREAESKEQERRAIERAEAQQRADAEARNAYFQSLRR